MPSDAYAGWAQDRQDRIDELLAAHAAVGGTGRGRRWRTKQLNAALVLLLSAEFQGFARDLHDLAVDYFVVAAADSNPDLANVLRVRLTEDRQLDRGNAHPGALGRDFSRFGLTLWPALKQADYRSEGRRISLDALNRSRNALAHANQGELVKLRQEGYPIGLDMVRRWNRALDGLAATMDDVVSVYLDGLFGRGRPW